MLVTFWLFSILLSACALPTSTSVLDDNSIRGIVVDEENHPIPGAIVRVKATNQFTTTDSEGKYALTNLDQTGTYLLTAWAPGYYNGGGDNEYTAGNTNALIVLKEHADIDNLDYQWISAYASDGVKGGQCESCHSSPDLSAKGEEISLPFDEWSQDAHSSSTQNPRFLSMYLGRDVQGNQSPPTRYGYSRDYGSFPLPPDLTQQYFGPGYKLDFPETAGNCAACHAPVAAINDPYSINPAEVSGVGEEGVNCDFCHKIWNVRLDSIGLPQINMPGVLSFEFRRPPDGHQFFAGPFDDVAPGEDTYTPIQRQSQFCAPCHFGSFWDTPIYNSFGEWLNSPYSNPQTGKTCQDCHMPAGKSDHFARFSEGAMVRNPQTIFSHLMPGASDEGLLQASVSMEVSTNHTGDKLTVTVMITNDKTGHYVPTDSPLRQMILLVNATDGMGQPLSFLDGGTIPEWGGIGDPASGYYAGLPGKGFAKILMELWTEVTPTAAYWNPTRIISDNRLAPFGSDTSTYTFAMPLDTNVDVNVTLFFRRAFKELMDQKSWNVADIVMAQQIINVKRKR
jgi:hypothetical protein